MNPHQNKLKRHKNNGFSYLKIYISIKVYGKKVFTLTDIFENK